MLVPRNYQIRTLIWITVVLGIMVYFSGCKEGTKELPVGAMLEMPKTAPEIKIGTGSYQLVGYVKTKGSGTPVGNISVSLWVDNTYLGFKTRTTSEGLFSFSGLGAALYELRVAEDSNKYASTSYFVQIFNDGKTSPASPEILLTELIATDTSKAKYPIIGFLKSEGEQKPVGLEAVRLIGSNSTVLGVTYSGNDGKFEFANVPPGIYTLQAGYGSTQFQEKNIQIELFGDGTVFPSIIILSPITNVILSTIQGKVYKIGTKEPVNFVEVCLYSEMGTLIEKSHTTTSGYFSFENKNPGMYKLIFDPDEKQFNKQEFGVKVLSNGTVEPSYAEIFISPKIDPVKTFDISGKVWDAFTGNPLEYVTCNIKGFNQTISDVNGKFNFQSLTPGIYQLKFEKMGFDSLEVSFSLDAQGKTIPANLSYSLIYSQEKGKGSIAGRYTPPEPLPAGISLSDYWVLLYEYSDLKTKVSGTLSESDYDLIPNYIKFTQLNAIQSGELDQLGTFKFTHLNPQKFYLVFIGKKGSNIATHLVPIRYNEITWLREDTSNPDRLYSWDPVRVFENTTTFLSNYEPANK